MQQNKVDIIDRGWESMHEILEREMPQKNRRRSLLLWLIGLGIGILLVVSLVFQFSNTDNNDNILANANDGIQKIINETESDHQHSKESEILNEEQGENATKIINNTTKNSAQNEIGKNDDALTITNNQISTTQKIKEKIENETEKINQNPAIIDKDNQFDLAIESASNELDRSTSKEILHDAIRTEAKDVTGQIQQKNATVLHKTTPSDTQNNSKEKNSETTAELLKIKHNAAQHSVVSIDKTESISKENKGITSVVTDNNTTVDIKNNSTVEANSIFQIDDLSSENVDSKKTPLFASEIESIDLLTLMPYKTGMLDLPVRVKLPMTIALADIIKTEEYKKRTYFQFGFTGLYLHNVTGSGIETFAGISREISPTISVNGHIGISFINLDNTPNLGGLDLINSRSDVPVQENNDPAGPQGPDGAAPPLGVDQAGANGSDIESDFEMEDLMLSEEQLQRLAYVNLDELLLTTVRIGLEWNPNNTRLKLGSSFGFDYVLDSDFNELYISNNQLILDNSLSNNLTLVDLKQDTSVLPFAEIGVSYSASDLIDITVNYKNYFKSIFPSKDIHWLNQIKFGMQINFPMKNK